MLKLKLIDFWKKMFFVILHFFILLAFIITNVEKNKNAKWRVFSKKFFHFFYFGHFFFVQIEIFKILFRKKRDTIENFFNKLFSINPLHDVGKNTFLPIIIILLFNLYQLTS